VGFPSAPRHHVATVSTSEALTVGFQHGLLLAAIFLAAAAVIALRSPNTHGEQAAPPEPVPTPELASEVA
jgi:hypothetical protein